MGEEKMLLSETGAHVKEKEAQMAFDTFDAFKVWGCESPHAKCDNRCRECMWFNPAYDLCYFFGTARIDDLACESFHRWNDDLQLCNDELDHKIRSEKSIE